MFQKDLLRQLRKWRAKEHRIVLMMNANEDVLDSMMCRELENKNL